MWQRGDYVVPFFNDQYRFDKPPFTYWAQVASYRVFGENDFAARFPSAVAAALVALLLLAWGRRCQDERAGWWAAIIFTLCLQTFMHAKAAVADMWLVLFMTVAHRAGFELIFDSLGDRSSPAFLRRKWWWIFYLSLALAFLAKGPVGWLPLLTVALMKFVGPQQNLARRFAFVRGGLLMFAVVGLWGIPALVRTHGEFFRIGIGHHVIGRSLATMEGHGGNSLGGYLLLLPFYFVTVFLSFFPWSLKLPWLTRQLWRERDALDKYLITGIAVIFLIFTLVKTKLPHYTLPAFPLLALLLARQWSRVPNAGRRFRQIATVTALLLFAIALFVFPFSRRYFPAVQLFAESKNDLRPSMQFAAVGYNEPSLVWYFRGRVGGFCDSSLQPNEVMPFMTQTGPRFVILPDALASKLYPTLPNEWKSFSANGFNIAKGKRVDLTLLLKPF